MSHRLSTYEPHRTLYKTTFGTLSQFAWQQLPKIEAQSIVPLHWDSHFLDDILLSLSQKPIKKHQKRHHFEVASLLGLEHLRYQTKELLVTTHGWKKVLSTGIA